MVKKAFLRKTVTKSQVDTWKRNMVGAQKRLDRSVVFLRGVDVKLEQIEQQKQSILASCPVMEKMRDDARKKIRFYDDNIKMYERIANARKRLAEEERKLRHMEGVDRERQFGRNIAK